MSKFSIRPTATLRGRIFKVLRSWSGTPTRPPEPVADEMSPADRLADSEVAVTERTPDPLGH